MSDCTGGGVLQPLVTPASRLCSISCSCCNARTNAPFSRFVCSCFNARFWFVVTQRSQITDLEPGRSRFQTGVKSVWHWTHSNGVKTYFTSDKAADAVSTLVWASASTIHLTASSRPTSIINSALVLMFGIKFISGGGGFGGGIWSKVFSSCRRRASLAAAWRWAAVCSGAGGGCEDGVGR